MDSDRSSYDWYTRKFIGTSSVEIFHNEGSCVGLIEIWQLGKMQGKFVDNNISHWLSLEDSY